MDYVMGASKRSQQPHNLKGDGYMHWERSCLLAGHLGMMQRQLNEVIAHAQQRQQFRKSIGKFQAISHRIVDMACRIEAAQALLYRACWLRDDNQQATAAVAMAKLAISEAAIQNGLDAIQIFGGEGVSPGASGVLQELLDALPGTIFSGTSEVQRNLIATELGL